MLKMSEKAWWVASPLGEILLKIAYAQPFAHVRFRQSHRDVHFMGMDIPAWVAQLRKYLGSWPDAAGKWFTAEWGISPAVATKFAILYAALHFLGLSPRINSGWRDPEKQKALVRQWNSGDRSGFIGKPASPDGSRHCRTTLSGDPASTAIDMPCADNNLGAKVARVLGLRAGVDFNDPGHYDGG